MSKKFEHHQSAHCENGVASNLLAFNDLHLSEPMIFGIGSGILFFYMPLLRVYHAPGFSFRPTPGAIFNRVANKLGIKIKRQKFKNPQKAQEALDQNLAKNIPTGLQIGVYNLSYFPDEYRFHFNAHNIVVFGKEGDRYLISDPVMLQTTSLSVAELEKVRFSKGILAPHGHMYYPTYVPKNIDLEKAIIKGIKLTCFTMLAPLSFVGVKAIRRVAKNIVIWHKKKGAKITNHYLAQLVRMQEEIGTGGGGFRYVYAAFLQEASDILKNKELFEMSKEMTAIGDLWRDFAVEIARVYKNRSNTSNVYQVLSDKMMHIYERENAFFRKLKRVIKKNG
ncbi:MAG: BtrH N-terminal domain-containing protein [Chitinophagales bacterium]|nr:BtrH N-terminal domain-containing protein [Chitinophagales bacterium]